METGNKWESKGWQQVRAEPLGKGGQSTVYLVRRPQRVEERRKSFEVLKQYSGQDLSNQARTECRTSKERSWEAKCKLRRLFDARVDGRLSSGEPCLASVAPGRGTNPAIPGLDFRFARDAARYQFVRVRPRAFHVESQAVADT